MIQVLPFINTILASLLPYPSAFFDSRLLTFVPDLLIFLSFISYLFYGFVRGGAKIVLSSGWFWLITLLFAHVGLSIVMGKGPGSLGSVSLILTTFVFIQFLRVGSQDLNPMRLVNQLVVIYLLHIAGIYFEFGTRLMGFSELFESCFGNAADVTKYKTYNHAHFIWWFFGLPDSFYGLNGLLLGSQAAGQIAAFAIVIFAPWYRWSPLSNYRSRLLFLISIFGFLLASNVTSVFILAIVILLMIYFFKNSKLNNITFGLSTPFVIIIFFSSLVSFIFYKIKGGEDAVIYQDAFMSSVNSFVDLGIFEKLFGVGRVHDFSEFADFGLGMLLNQVGLLFVLVVLSAFMWLMRASILQENRAVRIQNGGIYDDKIWIWLATVNGLGVIAFAISLVHYTPAIELGGRQMFAFHCAILYVVSQKLREIHGGS